MVPDDTRRISYDGDGTDSTFPFTFLVYSEEHLLVKVIDSAGAVTELTLDTDFSVDDDSVGNVDGGSITLIDADQDWVDSDGDLDTGFTLTIERTLDLVQELNLSTASDTSPHSIEVALDKMVMILQQQQSSLNGALVLDSSEDADDFTLTLPTVDQRAGKIFSWDADGNPTTSEAQTVGADPAASFITISAESSLTGERRLQGTANQITITDNGANSTVVLSTPQNLHTAATPTFGGLTLGGALAVTGATTVTGTTTVNGATNLNEAGADADTRIEGDTATNLFLCDASIDAVQIGTTVAGVIADFRSSGIVFNENGADRDIRMEGDTVTDLLFLDASTDRVGVGESTPESRLHVNQTASGVTHVMILENSGSAVGGADIREITEMAKVQTTDNTVTTMWSTAATAWTGTLHVFARVVALRTDTGTQSASYIKTGTFRSDGATWTQIDATETIQTDTNDGTWAVTFDATLASNVTLALRVQGANGRTIKWHGKIEIMNVPS